MKKMQQGAKVLVVIQDIVRTKAGFFMGSILSLYTDFHQHE